MENDKTPSAVPTKEELQAFIQARSYYYIPKWESFDPTLKHIAPGTFNWAACVFNVFWMAYRRMYLFVIILVAIGYSIGGSIELIFGLRTSLTNYLGIAMMILLGRYGNSIYRKHVERKIRQIKTKIAPEHQSQAFRDSGGTSLWAPIPLIILQLLTLYGMYLGIVQKNVKTDVVANTSIVAPTEQIPAVQTPAEQPPSVQTPTDSELDKDKKLAENGDVNAQYYLGYSYYTGNGVAGVSQDYEEAVKWFHKAADQGNATAQRLLGSFYYNGLGGLTVDYAEAAKWYRKAADQNEIIAEWSLGECYASGQGVPQDYEEAVKWYRKAADQGDVNAQLQLAHFYLFTLKDNAESVKWYQRAANQNAAYAQDVLGQLYRDGQGVTTNLVEAYKWFNLASAQGYVNPNHTEQVRVWNDYQMQQINNLGLANNAGTTQSPPPFPYQDAKSERDAVAALITPDQIAEGQRLSREFQPHTESAATNSISTENPTTNAVVQPDAKQIEADRIQFEDNKAKAEKGDATAQRYLGYCYDYGKGVTKDLDEAIKWYRKAAVQGDAKAQYNLGLCYYSSNGVAVDYAEAAKWFRKAANQNDARAQFFLGVGFANGQGVATNYVEAAKWYRKAADQNIIFAQYNLGICYHNGMGVTNDDIEAVKWLNLASAHYEPAKKSLSVIEQKMTPEQIAQAQQLSSEFQPHTESASTNSN